MKGERDEPTDISDKMKLFRSIVNEVKRGILNESESYKNGVDIQDKTNLNGLVRRIHQFGAIIVMILDNIDNPTTERINEHFMKHKFDFSKLSDDEKAMCKYYVKNDIQAAPFDLKPGHINSKVSVGDA